MKHNIAFDPNSQYWARNWIRLGLKLEYGNPAVVRAGTPQLDQVGIETEIFLPLQVFFDGPQLDQVGIETGNTISYYGADNPRNWIRLGLKLVL